MDLRLPSLSKKLTSPSQIAGRMTEAWIEASLYCPSCSNDQLCKHTAGKPVNDFFCSSCKTNFELKSQRKPFGKSLANGAFSAKQKRLSPTTSPELLLLEYELKTLTVKNLFLVPSRFFQMRIIEKRKPLGPNARRAGWVGSTIRLDKVPNIGRIEIVRDGHVMKKEVVRSQWAKSSFLEDLSQKSQGWLLDVMECVDAIPTQEFTLNQVYAFEEKLASLYPSNKNVRPKIRQQLQIMRSNGLIEFLGKGRYRKTATS